MEPKVVDLWLQGGPVSIAKIVDEKKTKLDTHPRKSRPGSVNELHEWKISGVRSHFRNKDAHVAPLVLDTELVLEELKELLAVLLVLGWADVVQAGLLAHRINVSVYA